MQNNIQTISLRRHSCFWFSNVKRYINIESGSALQFQEQKERSLSGVGFTKGIKSHGFIVSLVLRFTNLGNQWKINKNLNDHLAFQPLFLPRFKWSIIRGSIKKKERKNFNGFCFALFSEIEKTKNENGIWFSSFLEKIPKNKYHHLKFNTAS